MEKYCTGMPLRYLGNKEEHIFKTGRVKEIIDVMPGWCWYILRFSDGIEITANHFEVVPALSITFDHRSVTYLR